MVSTALVIILASYIGGKSCVQALWNLDRESKFGPDGEGWPVCVDTEACCPLIFSDWHAQQTNRHAAGAELIYSAEASMTPRSLGGNPRLIEFSCFDNRSPPQIAGDHEEVKQGPLYMLCPQYTVATLYHGETVDYQGAVTEHVRGTCDPPANLELEKIKAGLAVCRNFVAKLAGHAKLLVLIAKGSSVSPLNPTTGSDPAKIGTAHATTGFYISVTPLNGPVGRGPTNRQETDSLVYENLVRNQVYRVCGQTPPGQGNFNLILDVIS